MKKKGFTLVELLAVIAILAILVIVAMPNVLGMFSNAKVNTFVTEVQKYMDTAKTAFVQQAVTMQAQNIVFTSEEACETYSEGCTKKRIGDGTLDMEGNKEYYISLNRHGEFTRVVVWDPSLCYDSGDLEDSDKYKTFEKTTVTNKDIYNSDTTDGIVGKRFNAAIKYEGGAWQVTSKEDASTFVEIKNFDDTFCTTTAEKAVQE